MKPFLKQFLILGGFYFIISYFFNFSDSYGFVILNGLSLFCLVVMIIILYFKKSFNFLNKLHKNHPKIYLYLITVGFLEYLGMIVLGIPGRIYGYKAAMAQYKGGEYVSSIPEYLGYVSLIYWAFFVIALLWATYMNFIKKSKAN